MNNVKDMIQTQLDTLSATQSVFTDSKALQSIETLGLDF